MKSFVLLTLIFVLVAAVIVLIVIGLWTSFPGAFAAPIQPLNPPDSGTGIYCDKSPLICSLNRRDDWESIRSGKLQVSDISRCLEGLEPTCYGQNPTTPYTIPNFFTNKYPTLEGLPLSVQIQLGVYKLDPSQVLVLYGPSRSSMYLLGIHCLFIK